MVIRLKISYRRLKRILALFIAVAIVGGIFLQFRGNSIEATWYNDAWKYRKKITIDKSKVSGTTNLTNFPVLINITSDVQLQKYAQSTGNDILFTNEGGTKLNHEIETYNSANGAMIAWVQVDTVNASNAATNTEIYLYYGNATVGSQQSVNNTWNDGSYKGVWHLKEDPSGSAPQMVDSTATGGNGTTAGSMAATDSQAGQINKALQFNGSTEYVNVGNVIDLSGNVSMTLATWVKPHLAPATKAQIVAKYNTGTAGEWYLSVDTTRAVGFLRECGGFGTLSTSLLPLDQWSYVVGTYDGTNLRIYINGNIDKTTPDSCSITAKTTNIRIGAGDNTSGGQEFLNGFVDNVTVAKATRSADWVKTEYNNQNSPSTFYTMGSPVKSPTVLYWKLEEGNGTVANDASNNGKTGVISASSMWSTLALPNRLGSFALMFDGSSNKVTRAYSNDSELDPGTGDITVAAWFRHQSAASGTQTLIDRFSTTGYKAYMDSTGKICFAVSDATHNDVACTDSTYNDNAWHHFEGVRDTTNGKINVFIDGVLRKQITLTATATISGATLTFSVGVAAAGNNYWNGFIDEVKVMTTARSAQQVKTDVNVKSGLAGVAATIGQNSAATSLSSGLAGYWKMDELSWAGDCTTADVIDSSGNGGTGKACNSLNSTNVSKFGYAGSFNGSNKYVLLADGPAYNPSTQQITLSAWINTASLAANERIFSKDDGSLRDYFLQVLTTGEVKFGLWNSSGSLQQAGSGAGAVTTTGWYHVAATYNGNELVVYVNGVRKGSTPQTGNMQDTAAVPNIGRFVNGEYFNGNIDEVRVYNRALSPAEVSTLYNWAPGPIGYWKFDENKDNSCSGGVNDACDSSGNGQDGAQQGSGVSHWKPGKVGSAGYFDGVTDRIEIANTNALNMRTGAMTVSAWVFAESYPSSFPEIVKKDNEFILRHDGTNIQFFTWAAAAANQVTYTFDIRNKWYYITGVYDAKDPVNTQKLYVNGVLVSQNNTQSGALANNTNTVGIGNQPGGGEAFKGRIDDVKIYNYGRTAKQVIEDMNGGHVAPGSPVASQLLYWKFDEGSGTTANNAGYGGATLNGTLANSPTWTNAGKYGKALAFLRGSPNNNRVSVTSPALTLTTFTVSAWAKKTGACGNGDCAIVTEGESSNSGWGLRFQNSSGEKLSFSIKDNTQVVYSVNGISDNVWYHVAASIDGSTVKLYLNGKLENSAAQTQTPNYVGQAFKVGNKNDNNDIAIDGTIDEVKFYNYVLTDDQIKLEFNQGKSLVLGAISTESDGKTASYASERAYCPPGNVETNCAAGQNPSPGGEWRFEEGTGATVNDSTGNANTGAWNGTGNHWGGGAVGRAGQFNGSDDFVLLADSTQLNPASSISISAWFRTTSLASNQRIFSKDDGSLRDYFLQLLTTGEVKWGLWNTSNSIIQAGSGAGVVVPNTWYHVEGTYDGSNMYLFINGVQKDKQAQSGAIHDSAAAPNIGRYANGEYFTGKIDEVKVYGYARSPAQVAWDYNRGRPVGWWKFDECTGATLYDASGNGNTGTWNGTGSGTQTSVGDCSTNASTARYNGKNGKINASLNFDGVDDYVNAGNNSSLNTISTQHTVSAWVKRAASNSSGFIAARGVPGSNGYGVGVGNVSGSGCGANQITASKFGIVNACVGNFPADTAWHLLSVVWSSTGVTAYIDGIASNPTDSNATAFITSSANFTIGTLSDLSYYFTGQIDDVRVYNYALSLNQIKLLYNNDAAVRFAPVTGVPGSP